MSCSATIVANNLFYRASLLNISHEGCRARIGAPLRSGESVQIALEAFHSLSGSVRWYKEGQVGIRFTNRISSSNIGQVEGAAGGRAPFRADRAAPAPPARLLGRCPADALGDQVKVVL
jgi:hypothetical protein